MSGEDEDCLQQIVELIELSDSNAELKHLPKVFLGEAGNYYWVESLQSDAVPADNEDFSYLIVLVVFLPPFFIVFSRTVQSLRAHSLQCCSYFRGSFIEYYEI